MSWRFYEPICVYNAILWQIVRSIFDLTCIIIDIVIASIFHQSILLSRLLYTWRQKRTYIYLVLIAGHSKVLLFDHGKVWGRLLSILSRPIPRGRVVHIALQSLLGRVVGQESWLLHMARLGGGLG